MVRIMIGADTKTSWAPEASYGAGPGATKYWFGLVQDHTPSEDEKRTAYRYIGGDSRNVHTFIEEGQDFSGKVSTISQVPNLWHYFFGAIAHTGSPTSTRTITESGTVPSFGIQDTQETIANEGLQRSINGCVLDSLNFKWDEGGPINEEIDYIAQSVSVGSAAATSVTAIGSVPYMWSMVKTTISGGSFDGTLTEVKSGHWTGKNGFITTHYTGQSGANTGNPSRAIGQPIPGEREYDAEVVMNMSAGTGADLYNNLYRAGSTFNANFYFFRTSGTDNVKIWMSGCKAMNCTQPSKKEGVLDQTLTWQPTSCGMLVKVDAAAGSAPQ